jgi:hypothetical protein
MKTFVVAKSHGYKSSMRNFSAFKIYLRGFSLLISLSLVLSVIAYLQGGTARRFIDQKMADYLGVQPTHPHQLHAPLVKSIGLRICKTRIESIEWSSGARIFEDTSQNKPRWMSLVPGGIARELNTIEIEKWFGINCVLRVLPLEPNQSMSFHHFLKLTFVGGESEDLKKGSSGELLFGPQAFKSQEVTRSLSELYQLAEFALPEPK